LAISKEMHRIGRTSVWYCTLRGNSTLGLATDYSFAYRSEPRKSAEVTYTYTPREVVVTPEQSSLLFAWGGFDGTRCPPASPRRSVSKPHSNERHFRVLVTALLGFQPSRQRGPHERSSEERQQVVRGTDGNQMPLPDKWTEIHSLFIRGGYRSYLIDHYTMEMRRLRYGKSIASALVCLLLCGTIGAAEFPELLSLTDNTANAFTVRRVSSSVSTIQQSASAPSRLAALNSNVSASDLPFLRWSPFETETLASSDFVTTHSVLRT